MNKLKWTAGLLLGYQLATAQEASRERFPDILDAHYTVKDTNNVTGTFFSDQGAWHAYALPANDTTTGFTGPLLMDMKGEWLSNAISQLRLYENGRLLELKRVSSRYYPGRMMQTFAGPGLEVTMELIFSGSREALLQTGVRNKLNRKRQLVLSWQGEMLLKRANVTAQGKGLHIAIAGSTQTFDINYLSGDQWQTVTNGNAYTSSKAIALDAQAIYQDLQSQRFTLEGEKVDVTRAFAPALAANRQRWDAYLKRLFTQAPVKDHFRRQLAVKSMVTLLSNWRSAARGIKHDGVFPSISYQGFYGCWSWDSWKQAAALAYIDPALAASNIQALFDYQEGSGMVPDCIYTDTTENNRRDTKPPLAAWAVWQVFQAGHDTTFLRDMLAPLMLYHTWWYHARDHDHNNICEYGSTDGTRIAAAWESGMDNAVRFDKAAMLFNHTGAWSLDQESVDLNAYLYKEKIILAQIARVLHQGEISTMFDSSAIQLKARINELFYDTASGFYYDRMLKGDLVRIKGAEGWIPLWAGVASKTQAKAVAAVMKDTTVFNTFVPLPVLDASAKAFDPQNGYWRGPVWMDQYYFGIMGLLQYGDTSTASALTSKLWQHAEGMQDNKPLYENYHPLTGKGLNAPNFSWTAAHIILLLAAQQ
ncbi:MGH1-like glycoside hydrolase domain-containing protein [Chitinophaga vietnamensis]|uniref:MGH1-like glycoside hydrolase domain-containing protein n=1 Tax=Chitinophaga vietnamensis TaxID=2593957 RepID=UPI001375E49B|nr:trehalase family glycosidase [Chitinophaga vietnamensis]